MSDDRIAGVILGTAVGDALGLPREGLSARRAARLFGDGPVEHALVGRFGMLSDDTDHTAMVVQAWLDARGDIVRFERSLARRLRWWFAALPPGVGLGTARAVVRLWLGFSPSRSGVRSAGNGPAMRCGVLGLLVDGDADELLRWVRAATRCTHTDPRAEQGAYLVALAVRHAAQGRDRRDFVARARDGTCDLDDELVAGLARMDVGLRDGVSVATFAEAHCGCDGASGYVVHTVPVALYAWLRSADFEGAVTAGICCGGDADTVAAITGAVAGAAGGVGAIPPRWIDGIRDFPRSTAWLRRLADRVAEGGPPLPLAWWLVAPRNVIQLVIVILHGLRRLGPPY